MVTKPNTFTDGQLPTGPQWDANWSTLYDYINGNIEASSIVSASATTSKFNDGTITAGKIATDVDFSNTQEFCFQETLTDFTNTSTHLTLTEGVNFRRVEYEGPWTGIGILSFRIANLSDGRNGAMGFVYHPYNTVKAGCSIGVENSGTLSTNTGGDVVSTTAGGGDGCQSLALIFSSTDSKWILLNRRGYVT